MKFIKKHIKLITIVIVLILIVSLGILKYYLKNVNKKKKKEANILENLNDIDKLFAEFSQFIYMKVENYINEHKEDFNDD